MNRSSRPQVLELLQPPASQSRSRSSSSTDNPLPSNGSTASLAPNPFINVNPPPAYIASSAATRLVTSDHEDFFRSLCEDGVSSPGTPTMFVTGGSLTLVNQFLDFLLYSFLSNAKSTSISALRPAITEVLRIRLATEAVAGADQELKLYLGGDDEDIESFDDDLIGSNGDEWNLENTWRKCRVQCMVYSSLGDLEEDDEAFYSETGLEGAVGLEQYERQNSNPGIISPAVAIWLTSILEFIGEQTLLVAGHATIARYSAQRIATASSPTSNASSEATFPDKPTVEELDTEKVALNPSLGRMWRQWRKKARSGRGSFSMPSRDGVLQRLERQASLKRGSAKDESRVSVASTVRGEDNVPTNQDERPDPPTLPDNFRAATLPECALTPIFEMATPGVPEGSKRFGPRDGEDTNGGLVMRRPHSLIILPWTNSPPFVLSSALRRPLSLPDLRRGDFADPNTEGGDIDEQVYLNIPLPQPGPNEEDELADFVTSYKDQDPSIMTRLPENMNRDPIGRDLVKVTETTALTPSSHQQAPAGTGPLSVSKKEPSELLVEPTDPDNEENEIVAAVGRAESKSPLPHPAEADYDPYAVKPSLPKTPTHPDAVFADDDSSPSSKSRSGSASQAHLKHASSSSSGHSLSDRKIGQLHLVQSSASSHSERGTNIRVWTPPATPDKSRRSSSFSKVQRPIHTSGSTSSSQASILKTFIPWPHDGGKHTRVHESDGESRSSHHSDHLASLDDKERSFEELISSGGTIHCTITPDPIRNMEKTRHSPGKTPTADLADFIRSTGPDGRPMTSKSIQGSPRVPTHRSSPARTDDNSTSLADFLKNTAPPGTSGYTLGNQSSSKLQKMVVPDPTPAFSIVSTSKNHGTFVPSSGLPSVIRQTRSDSPITSSPRNRLLARDASGSTGSDTTSALADFFRNTTPPANGEQPIHRIPRSVAPFRNTMDSAQFNPETDVDAIKETGLELSIEARSVVSAPPESYSSSFTSSTALLSSSSKKTVDYGSATNIAASSMPDMKRRQVRAKDPYAIAIDGLDDDDIDDMELNLVLPKKREEESLVDFLRNMPPPPPTVPQPLLVHTNAKTLQKKSSSVSLMSRFGRSGRKNSISSNADKASIITQGTFSAKHVPLKVPNGSEVHIGRPGSGLDQYARPSQSQARADFDNLYSMGSSVVAARSPLRANVQARGARAARNDTDSLADFLKHTGPPPEARVARPQKEEGRSLLQKMSFSRNKKVGVA
ncbi:hypothetical protein BDD12DRAFT_810837 [Trichophaea hybrida]|nr:hypothetical protein BDD12DRAFT_810837 [Trichophaea hybrida]